jgi:hypothetical protein
MKIINNIDNYDDIFIKYLPKININTDGSYYCELSNDCKKNELEQHEYKYTIIKVIQLK